LRADAQSILDEDMHGRVSSDRHGAGTTGQWRARLPGMDSQHGPGKIIRNASGKRRW
jgi:hypothetical protein